MTQSIRLNRDDFEDVPEWETLHRTVMQRLADNTMRDLEEIQADIMSHIAIRSAPTMTDDERDGEAWQRSYDIMQNLIWRLPVDKVNCERLLNWTHAWDDLTAYDRLITEYTDLLPPGQLRHLVSHGSSLFVPEITDHWEHFAEDVDIVLLLKAIVTPHGDCLHGSLISVLAPPWKAIAALLANDWENAFNISPRQWEEIIAGAFDMAGFDDVILTPRSGDHGRDVIAVKHGACSIRIIDSVKAYRPDHSVAYDDVRALLGVLHGDPNASKGILTTTSTFPPHIYKDPFISPFIPHRLELMDGARLRSWLGTLAKEA